MSRISFDKKLRKEIKKTTETLVKAVKSTLGPSGTNVGVLDRMGLPSITNDGVTVAQGISFEDPLQNYIANILKTVSNNTDKIASDGTTTSLTLSEAIILDSIKHIEAGFSQIDITKGIKIATKLVLEELEKNITPVDKDLLLKVATISANNDKELGKLISDTFLEIGVDGKIDIDTSYTGKDYVEITPGVTYPNGYESNQFINTEDKTVVFNDCKILLVEGKVRNMTEIMPLLSSVKLSKGSLLIIAEDYDRNFINDLASQKGLNICVVISPGVGDQKENYLDDIAFLTNSKIVSTRYGSTLENFDLSSVGFSKSVKVTRDDFSIINDFRTKEEIAERVENLKFDTSNISGNEKRELTDRIAKLSSGEATLHIHGDSPIEVTEKNYRIDDSVGSTRAALEEGIVPGGGVTLFKVGKSLKMPKMENKDQEIGFNILINALESLITTICINSGESPDIVKQNILESDEFNYGFDAKTKKYGDLIEAGVIDPVLTTKTALINASSVSQMLISMNTCVFK